MSYTSFDWRNYLKNYPDLKEAGIDNCEKAWGHYQKFGKHEGRLCEILVDVSKYKVLYKINSYIIDFSDIIEYKLNGEVIKMYSSTPTIIECVNGYILNIRYVNYIIKKYDPFYTYSLNKYILLDKSFIKQDEYFYDYNFKNDLLKHKGLEDIKLFNDNDKIYYIGNIFELKKSCITSGILNKKVFEGNVLQTTFTNNKCWEKNWCFVKYKNKLSIVYNWFPITLCNVNYLTNKLEFIKEITSPIIFENIRGSTNGYIFNNEIWFITHVNNKGDYFHLFVIFDLEMNLLRYSEYFKFEDYPVEFCLGLIIEKSRILISYSTNDSTTKLMIIDKLSLLFNII